MSASATLTISATTSGMPQGAPPVSPPSAAMANGVYESLLVTLQAGDNAIAVPTGAQYAVITPPPGNTIGVTFKGGAADTGVKMHLTNSAAFPLDATVSSFILSSASAMAAATTVAFIG